MSHTRREIMEAQQEILEKMNKTDNAARQATNTLNVFNSFTGLPVKLDTDDPRYSWVRVKTEYLEMFRKKIKSEETDGGLE